MRAESRDLRFAGAVPPLGTTADPSTPRYARRSGWQEWKVCELCRP